MSNIDAVETIKKTNPLLEKLNKIPGTTIRLPSRGLFYNNGELDPEVQGGEIYIRPMTLTDEILMKSPDMLFQGTAVENVIKRCAPQVLKPTQLLVNDIDYILTNLSKVSYGATVSIEYNCECQKPNDSVDDDTPDNKKRKKKKIVDGSNIYDIPIDTFIRKTKELDPKKYSEIFRLTVEGFDIRLRPMKFSDMLALRQIDGSTLTDPEELRNYIAKTLSSFTESVDGVTDPEHIMEWYRFTDVKITKEIDKLVESINDWGIEFKFKINCNSCGKEVELTHQLNPTHFFTQRSRPKT